jgi:tripartite-type tricarboxylate transporter receptor subunit TctC
MGAWRGFGLPKGASAERFGFYGRALQKVYESADFKNFMETNGFGMVGWGSKEPASFMEQQDQTMGQPMKDLGLAK